MSPCQRHCKESTFFKAPAHRVSPAGRHAVSRSGKSSQVKSSHSLLGRECFLGFIPAAAPVSTVAYEVGDFREGCTKSVLLKFSKRITICSQLVALLLTPVLFFLSSKQLQRVFHVGQRKEHF